MPIFLPYYVLSEIDKLSAGGSAKEGSSLLAQREMAAKIFEDSLPSQSKSSNYTDTALLCHSFSLNMISKRKRVSKSQCFR
ncbi:MAG: hypothetical protein M1374_07360, partial [Firmicutes bacterium]|nr:hypothetical protein [Bacillota bacterium]